MYLSRLVCPGLLFLFFFFLIEMGQNGGGGWEEVEGTTRAGDDSNYQAVEVGGSKGESC